MNKNRAFIWLAALLLLVMQGCRLLNPQQMFRTAGYELTDMDSTMGKAPYRISPDDEFQLSVNSNAGEKLLDPTGMYSNLSREFVGPYIIDKDSAVKIPVLGRVKIGGMTIIEAEQYLEKLYSDYFITPFVKLNVINQRVIVFPGGSGGTARVINLTNRNTTILEALALAGGINDGKAYRVKLIRGNPEHPTLYEFDLSTVEGMKYAGIVVQANDVIYVEPRRRYFQKFVESLAPYMALTSTILLIYNIIK